jgi:hypothetical protein
VKTPILFLVVPLVLAGCPNNNSKPTGMVPEAGTTPVTSATVTPPDPATCCQMSVESSWTFEGIYKDSACTEPLAQIVVPACGVVPPLGAMGITYVDAVGLRKANETANVTLGEIGAPEAQRFRKAGNACVRANEGGLAFTPPACAGQRACRDANGQLVCTGCRTFANGCADYEQTRLYATIADPGLKTAGGGGGGGGTSYERLAKCCQALAAEAQRLGPSPESGVLMQASGQCLALVTAAGPNGNPPELGAIRTALQGRQVPAICAGF